MPYRVIQWTTGNVGRAAVSGILGHPELSLVGCWVNSEAKDGRDVGEICGLARIGLDATRNVEALLALDADCVLYSPLLGSRPEVTRILASGKNVVTPLDWFYPFGSSGVAEVEAACREGGSSLHGTGIHPGGITEQFPLMLSALCQDIRHVRAEEFSDIRTYSAVAVIRDVMLFGSCPEDAARSPMTAILGHGFSQSIDLVAAGLDLELDPDKRTTHEMAVATRPIESPIGPLAPGTVAAQRFTWEGLVDGEPVIMARVNWLMGEAHLEPAWSFGPGGERFEVEIRADPPVRVSFHGLERNPGILATAMHCVNSIPAVCRAEPGIRTVLDLPLVSGRAVRPRARSGCP
jgi:hypothetical protein